jgi:hypothetical protein
VFPHMVFFLFLWFFLFFFQNSLCRFYFFYIELVENLASCFFLKNTMDCYSVPPHDFFFVMIFFKIVFINCRFTTVDFLMKHYRLLQCFPACLFSLSVFFMIFFKI